jgi:protocatechuate 3,4-dioxygenase beta subunit
MNMTRIPFLLAVILTLVLPAPNAAAQVVVTEDIRGGSGMQMPAREFKSGTGRIRGRIYTADTGAPVRRAQVRLSGPEVGARTATTDAEGRFDFRELPAGRFTISASKSGYVSIQYGQTRPFESGKTIELSDAQSLDRADIAMPRGGVITGRIVDEFGEPMPDTTVQALRSTWSNGRRRLQATGRTAVTNDLGQYRLFGLPPGEYYVSATMAGSQLMQVEAAMTEMVAIRTVQPAGATASSSPSPTSGYAPTYYPGTTSGAEAQRITVSVGQEMHGADIALSPVRLASVSGTVINSEGRPVEATMVNLIARNRDTTGPVFGIGNSGRTDRNGNFTINGVAPGEYTLQTRGATVVQTQAGEGRTMVFTMRSDGGGPGGEAEVGSVPLNVSGDDLSHVVVMTAKGGRATGQVIFEGGMKPEKMGTIRVMASPVDADGPAMAMMGGSGAVQADGSFEIGGLAGGRLIRVANVPQGWTLKSVRFNGQDITDTGAEFRAGETVSGLDIVLTSRLTQINGTVAGHDSEAVKDYTVVIFSDDEALWTAPQSRHVTGVRPDQEGRFQVRNLPPGGYYAVAVDYIEQGTWGDPDTLGRLKALASTFTLRDGENKTLDLKLAR